MVTVTVAVSAGAMVIGFGAGGAGEPAGAATPVCQTSPVDDLTTVSNSRAWATAVTDAVPAGGGAENGPGWARSVSHTPAATFGASMRTVALLPGSGGPMRSGSPVR